jgi:hypothetical protein
MFFVCDRLMIATSFAFARYVPHLKALFEVGGRSSSLTWLEAGNSKK